MRVSIDVRGGSVPWDPREIERVALTAMREIGVSGSSELSVSLVGTDEIAALNASWRGIEAPTDVLSLPMDGPDLASYVEPAYDDSSYDESAYDDDADAPPVELGDVVMCTDVIDAQRAQFGTTFGEEASLMLVHSILHLVGFDHADDASRAEMEAAEKRILEAAGFPGVR